MWSTHWVFRNTQSLRMHYFNNKQQSKNIWTHYWWKYIVVQFKLVYKVSFKSEISKEHPHVPS